MCRTLALLSWRNCEELQSGDEHDAYSHNLISANVWVDKRAVDNIEYTTKVQRSNRNIQ